MVPPLLTFDGKLHWTSCVSCAFLSIKTKRKLGYHQAGWVNMILCKKYPVLLIKSLKNDSKIPDNWYGLTPVSWLSGLAQVILAHFSSRLCLLILFLPFPPPFFYYENEGWGVRNGYCVSLEYPNWEFVKFFNIWQIRPAKHCKYCMCMHQLDKFLQIFKS